MYCSGTDLMRIKMVTCLVCYVKTGSSLHASPLSSVQIKEIEKDKILMN